MVELEDRIGALVPVHIEDLRILEAEGRAFHKLQFGREIRPGAGIGRDGVCCRRRRVRGLVLEQDGVLTGFQIQCFYEKVVFLVPCLFVVSHDPQNRGAARPHPVGSGKTHRCCGKIDVYGRGGTGVG